MYNGIVSEFVWYVLYEYITTPKRSVESIRKAKRENIETKIKRKENLYEGNEADI